MLTALASYHRQSEHLAAWGTASSSPYTDSLRRSSASLANVSTDLRAKRIPICCRIEREQPRHQHGAQLQGRQHPENPVVGPRLIAESGQQLSVSWCSGKQELGQKSKPLQSEKSCRLHSVRRLGVSRGDSKCSSRKTTSSAGDGHKVVLIATWTSDLHGITMEVKILSYFRTV